MMHLAHDLGRFCFIMVGQLLDRKQCGRERGMGLGKVREPGLELGMHVVQRRYAICRHAAHEAIGADYRHVLKMWCQKYFNFYTQCRSSMSVPKQRTNQTTPEAGQELQAFVDRIKLAWQLFYLTETSQRHVKMRSV